MVNEDPSTHTKTGRSENLHAGDCERRGKRPYYHWSLESHGFDLQQLQSCTAPVVGLSVPACNHERLLLSSDASGVPSVYFFGSFAESNYALPRSQARQIGPTVEWSAYSWQPEEVGCAAGRNTNAH